MHKRFQLTTLLHLATKKRFASVVGLMLGVALVATQVAKAEVDFSFTESHNGMISEEVTFDGTVTSDNGPITAMKAFVDEVDVGGVEAVDGDFDGSSEEFTFLYEPLVYSAGPHTLYFTATDNGGEMQSEQFILEYGLDETGPVITFTKWSEGEAEYGSDLELGVPEFVYEFSVVDEDSPIEDVEFVVDDGDGFTNINDTVVDGAVDEMAEEFYFLFDQRPYADGVEHTITIYAYDSQLNETTESFTFTNFGEPDAPYLEFSENPEEVVDTTTLHYEFIASDEYLESVVAYIDNVSNPVSLSPTQTDVSQWEYSEDVDITGFDDGELHTLYIVLTDFYQNETVVEDTFRYVFEETVPPIFNFNESNEGLSPKQLRYTGAITDDSGINQLFVEVDGQYHGSNYESWNDPEAPKNSVEFEYNINDLSEGLHTITFVGKDLLENEVRQDFIVDVDASPPTCEFYNLPSPHYSKIITYSDVVCTDNRGITDAAIDAYHVVEGTLISENDTHGTLPVDSTFGDTTETFTYTYDLTAFETLDGIVLFTFYAYDEAGNRSYDYDPLVLEVSDGSVPTVNLDEVTPNPLTDTSPTLTGACRDNTELETNSFISLMEYQVDGGGYTSVVPLGNGEYNDSFIESFSVELPVLSLNNHTVDVRCTDASGNSSITSDSFEIVSPNDPVPGEFTFVEDFSSTNNQDIPNSENTVWGNGQLRLKEDITVTRTTVDGNVGCGRYDDCRGGYMIKQDPLDENILWYLKSDGLHTYDISQDTSEQFDLQSIAGFNMSAEVDYKIGIFNGKKYLWMADIYRLVVINLTDETLVLNDDTLHEVHEITLDFDRGRLGAYIGIEKTGEYSTFAYIDLQNNEDDSDDILTRYPLTNFDGADTTTILLDSNTNTVYTGAFDYGVYKFHDNNTPANPTDDTFTSYNDITYFNIYGGMILDPDGKLIFATANNSKGTLFVVSDDGGTPFDATDDTVTQLSQPINIGYRSVWLLQYIVGENGVGDQIFIQTESNPVYLNFNSTYTDLTDDTFIELDTTGGVRPSEASIFVKDYNTLYSNNRRQGLIKVDLHRDWVSSGEAVALPNRPSEQLVINNFVADATVSDPISFVAQAEDSSFLAKIHDSIAPVAYAAGEEGIHYFVSTDGGVTYTEVTLNQLQQLQENDYLLKFKIVMEPVDGATPVLHTYSLTYGGYPTEEIAMTPTDVSVETNTNSTVTNTNFSVTVEVVDAVGFKVPSQNGTATLELIDTDTGLPTDGLSVDSAEVVDGGVTLSDVQINKVGTFIIRATFGEYTSDSDSITIEDEDVVLPTPSLNFTAQHYTIRKGEGVTLFWTSNNLTEFTIDPGNKNFNEPDGAGALTVYPEVTTEYRIVGHGPYGDITAYLTITIDGEVEHESSTSSPSPTPSASGVPTPSPAALLSSGSSDLDWEAQPPAPANVSPNQTIIQGQKATITWDIPGADTVYVEYPGYPKTEVSSVGGFDFFPNETTTVTITSIKDGVETTHTVTVTVITAPVAVQEVARALENISPVASHLVSQVLTVSRDIPKVAVATFAAVQLALMGTMVATIASQASLAALNFRTLADILRVGGILPFRKRKGFVHQAKTGEPIPFATISIYDQSKRDSIFATLVSDVHGIYYEPFLDKGAYQLTVASDGHIFPTASSRPPHLAVRDFYRGETLSVLSNKDQQSILMPMDPLAVSAQGSAIKSRILLVLSQILTLLRWLIYPLFALSIYTFIIDSSVFNGLILAVYSILLLSRLMVVLKRPTFRGTVVTDTSRRPLANVTLSLTQENGQLVGIGKTNKEGRFTFFAPAGKYNLNVVAEGFYWAENAMGTSYSVTIPESGTKNLVVKLSPVSSMTGSI